MNETATCPYVEQLRVGMSGPHVAAYQRMLHRWDPHVRPAWASPSEEHGLFGKPMLAQVKTFQEKHAIPSSGVIGPRTHLELVKSADRRACFLLREEYERRHPEVTGRELARQAALTAYAHEGQMTYAGPHSQWIPRRWQGIAEGIQPPDVPSYADCSSLATWCLWTARDHGAQDPSANGWKWGTTFSMEPNGRPVSAATAQPGDLFFYVGHVAIMVDRAQGVPIVVSFGGQGGPHHLAYSYRSDLTSVKNYVDDAA